MKAAEAARQARSRLRIAAFEVARSPGSVAAARRLTRAAEDYASATAFLKAVRSVTR